MNVEMVKYVVKGSAKALLITISEAICWITGIAIIFWLLFAHTWVLVSGAVVAAVVGYITAVVKETIQEYKDKVKYGQLPSQSIRNETLR